MRIDPLHWVWLVGYVFAAMILGGILNDALYRSDSIKGIVLHFGRSPLVTPFPYVVAGGLKIADGLDRFSGNPIIQEWKSEHLFLLLSILVSYVLAVPSFIWAIKERQHWRENHARGKFPIRIAFAIGIGGAFVVPMLLISAVGPVMSSSVRSKMQEAQTVYANRDAVMYELNLMALKAQGSYFVSLGEGGYGGKWMNIQRKGSPTVTLEELQVQEPDLNRVYAELYPQRPSKFVLEVYSEDSLAIWGIGAETSEGSLFVNKDGQQGKNQAHAVVTPKKVIVRPHSF